MIAGHAERVSRLVAYLRRAEIEVALRLDRLNLSARYAEAVLSGEADDPQAFQRMARRFMAQHPAGGRAAAGRSMADVVFGAGGAGRNGRR